MRLNERCVAEFSTSSAPTDKEGFLNKKGEVNRGYQRRWFILKGNLLYYFEKRSDKEPIGVIVLDNCHVELAESGEPYAFQITFGGDGSRTYILGADSSKEMEAWMRAITHSTYEYLKMMVESFECTLEKLTSEENDLVTASTSENGNSPPSISGASNFNAVDAQESRSIDSEAYFQMPVVSVTDDFGAVKNDRLDNFELPKSQQASGYYAAANSEVTLDRTEVAVGNLISLDVDDDDDDDQIPIQNEFAFDEGFYSYPKHSSELMPLSYSDLERLEDMHNEDLLNRLGGNIPSRSKDDFDVMTRVKREAPSRSLRPKSERRRNNVRTMYDNVQSGPSQERGKQTRTMPRSLSPQAEEGGYFSEHGSVFRYLHELYSASIWVKCKEFWRQDNPKS